MSKYVKETNGSPEAESRNYRFIELAAYILFGIGLLIGNTVLTPLGPISAQFLLNPTAILVAIPAFMFPFAFIQLFSGAISDVYGRVPVIAGGLIAFLAGIAFIAFSTSIEIFALGHIVSGVGFGFTNPVLPALLSDCSVPEDIPKKMGIASALASIAGMVRRDSWNSEWDMMVLGMDATGVLRWNSTYGGTSWAKGCSIIACEDGGFTVAGVKTSLAG
jgi:hypothetical protein